MVIALPAVLSSRKVRIWLFLKTPWHILNSRTLLKKQFDPPATTASPTCSTTSGQACVFPFTYNGVQHSACTLVAIMSWSRYFIYETRHVTIEVAKIYKILWSQSLEKGIIYNSCLSLQSGFPTPWCSTATDGSGVHVTGKSLFWIVFVASFLWLIFCHCTFSSVVLSFW